MYFIEYTKHKLIICCDDTSCYINLVINKYDGMYIYIYFFQFVYPKKYMHYAIKQVIKLKNNDSLLHKLNDICIDKYFSNPNDRYGFEYALLTNVFKNSDHNDVYFRCSNSCYDAFAGHILVSKIKTKVPLLYYDS